MIKFLFVTGSHKSGTSWLAHMINAHPKIALPDQELWLLGHENGLSECIDRAIGEWFKLPTVQNQFRTEKDVEDASRKIRRAALRGAIDASVSGLNDINVIGDKTPSFYAKNYKRLANTFPDAHYVHIVRDPRDVVVSHHFHAYRLNEWNFFGDPDRARDVSKRIDNKEHVGADLLDETAVRRLVREWKTIQESGLEARSTFSPRYQLLRYEDLLVDTTDKVAEIFSMVGEPLPRGDVAQITDRFTFEKMTAGRKLGESDPKSFFRKGGSGDWENYFSKSHLEFVNSAASDMMQHFGYL